MRDFRHCIFLWIFSIFLLSSCSPSRTDRSSVVVLLIESFGENDFICSDMHALDDLDDLKAQCDNFTRFTHAFAPSTLSQSVLSSLMTGIGIGQHRVFHNGQEAIPAKVETLAEKAIKNGMKTGFFSGGAPIFNKFGIHQGFEVFDHSYTSEPKSHFRPVLETMKASLKWVDSKVGDSPVFMTLYFPDLLHSGRKTTTDEGRERARDRQAQLHEVYESINNFVGELKKKERWKNTFLVIAGVNGQISFQGKSKNTLDDITSQRTHVSLQIKPDKRLREHFKKVHNGMLSLTDVGEFLDKFIFSKAKAPIFEDWFSQRSHKAIHIRSDWGAWHIRESLPLEGLRIDQYLFAFSPLLQVYDSFIDSKEIEPLSRNEALSVAKQYKLEEYIKNSVIHPCILEVYKSEMGLESTDLACETGAQKGYKKVGSLDQFLKSHWSSIQTNKDFSEVLWKSLRPRKGMKSDLSIGWLSNYYLRKENWEKLSELSKIRKNKYWDIVAKRNLNEKIQDTSKGCHSYFINKNQSLNDFYRNCEDSSLRKIAEGLSLLKSNNKALKSFWREVSDLKRKRKVKNLNLEMMLMNDVKEALYFEPSLSEHFFYLPENRKFRKLLEVNKS